ncbi:MAG: hypothetical protein WCG25_01090 [bacterium]
MIKTYFQYLFKKGNHNFFHIKYHKRSHKKDQTNHIKIKTNILNTHILAKKPPNSITVCHGENTHNGGIHSTHTNQKIIRYPKLCKKSAGRCIIQ